MVRSYAVIISTFLLTVCDFAWTRLAIPRDDRFHLRALHRALDEGYGETLALILQNYVIVNSTWSNPTYVNYDQKLIVALQNQLEDQGYETSLHHDGHGAAFPVHGGLRFFTYYCGPGNWSTDGSTVQNAYFSRIDQCCKSHDECPDTIVDRGDYRRYEELPYKPQVFTKLRCTCDVEFLHCLQNVSTFFSYAVAWIYTKFQPHCFEYEYPTMDCVAKKNDGLFSADRCQTYMVDNSIRRRWQWFDVPYISFNQLFFPEVEYRYEIDWLNILFARAATKQAKP
ncbi:uncharacterized protein LOC128278602 [Anopheles cruzii]|uniref:uncharacterized protein LOC128278602 n=1 Tax=Anopheles cruzii TaxID=68878 RepID=UPI0022EC8B48|nr:uncharacterized protein LOC128278602 [Anopheles cruzii]